MMTCLNIVVVMTDVDFGQLLDSFVDPLRFSGLVIFIE